MGVELKVRLKGLQESVSGLWNSKIKTSDEICRLLVFCCLFRYVGSCYLHFLLISLRRLSSLYYFHWVQQCIHFVCPTTKRKLVANASPFKNANVSLNWQGAFAVLFSAIAFGSVFSRTQKWRIWLIFWRLFFGFLACSNSFFGLSYSFWCINDRIWHEWICL